MFTTQVHLWAVFVAVVAHAIIGMLWYGPLFGKKWLAAMNVNRDQLNNPGMAMSLGVVVSVFKSYFLDRVVTLTGVTTIWGAMLSAFWIWFGFVLTFVLLKALYEKRNTTLVLLDLSFELVWFLVAGALIGWAI